MTVTFSRVIPTLRMFDIAKAREFYLGYLGFTVDFEHRFEPDLPLFLGISRGGLQLYLSEHHGDGSPGIHITVEMTGLADYHAELTAKNYGYMRPGLVQQPWGTTTMTVYDPFSNHIIFTEDGKIEAKVSGTP
jgi:catechol 2,3-dioxygenase-like lactoylglutathione lyase family enzyme